MDAALVGAILGVAGVVVGALATGFITIAAERRREKAQSRVTAGFIARELDDAEKILDRALDGDGRWWPPDRAPVFSEWSKRGPALLLGSRRRGTRFHAAFDALESLDPLARQAHGRVAAATQRISEIKAGGPPPPPEGADEPAPEQLAEYDRKWTEAAAELQEAVEQTRLTEADRARIQGAKAAVSKARKAVPKGWPVWLLNGIAVVAFVVVCGAVVGVGVVAVNAVQEATDTGDELAAALVAQRGATLASCDRTDDIDNAWDCHVAYAADGGACTNALESEAGADDGARTPVIVAATQTLSSAAAEACRLRAEAMIRAYEDDNRRFIGEVADLTLMESDRKQRRELRRRMRERLPSRFSGWIP